LPPSGAAGGGAAPEPAWLRNRAQLQRAGRSLARAVAGQADRGWRERVTARLAVLRAQLTEHVVATEGPGGLYAELLAHAPRLDRPVARLATDHQELLAQVDVLADQLGDRSVPPPALRQRAATLLDELSRHRQRGADLVYEAFATDLGGET
jgi:hypothetical protein